MHFEGTNGSDNNDGVGLKTADTTLDVAELLHANISTEASLGNHVTVILFWLSFLNTSKLEGNLVSEDGRVAVSDVGERTGMHKDWCALESLHQVRLDGIAHENGQ